MGADSLSGLGRDCWTTRLSGGCDCHSGLGDSDRERRPLALCHRSPRARAPASQTDGTEKLFLCRTHALGVAAPGQLDGSEGKAYAVPSGSATPTLAQAYDREIKGRLDWTELQAECGSGLRHGLTVAASEGYNRLRQSVSDPVL